MLETVFDMMKPNWKENSGQTHFTPMRTEVEWNLIVGSSENHPLRQCKQFLRLSVKYRIKFVYFNRYCSNYFSLNHFKSKCCSKVLCFRCKTKHHTLLHVEGENSRAFKEVSLRNEVTVSYNTHLTSNEKPKLTHIDLGSLPYGRATILPTALIYIQQAGDRIRKKFCVLKSSAKIINFSLGIPYQDFWSKGVCNLTLRTKRTDFSITIKAIICPQFSSFST